MYSVLIVDDEPYVRQGLRSIIDWEEQGFAICGEAENGEDGLKAILQLSPDLVITDLRMPEMDGLKLIKYSKTLAYDNLKFIIASGYNDFKYAQEAIKYRVSNYLLKPIDEEELINNLKKIKAELTSIKRVPISIQNVAKAYINGDIVIMDYKNDGDVFRNIIGEAIRYMEIEIDIPRWIEGLCYVEIHENNKQLNEILINIFKKENMYLVYEEYIGKYCAIVNEDCLKNYRGSIKTLCRNIILEIDKVLKCSCNIFVGSQVDNLTDIKSSYEDCRNTRDNRFFSNENNIYLHDEVNTIKYNYKICNDTYFEELVFFIENNDCIRISTSIDSIIKNVQVNRIAPDLLKVQIMIFMEKIISSIHKRNGDVEKFMNYFTKFKYWESQNLHGIRNGLTEFSFSSVQYLKSLEKSNSKSLIYEVEKYIRVNFAKDISLKILSDIFFLNPTYLGQLIKKNLGMYFNDYLNYIRVEESKKLLRRSDLKLCEIANAVGYSDTNYFICKFEKISHVTPTQYKKGIEN